MQIFDSDALHSKSKPTSRARLHHWTCGCPRTELGTIGRERVPCGLGASPLAEINLSILTQRHNLGSIWALARQYRTRPRRTWLHGKQASAFGRSARAQGRAAPGCMANRLQHSGEARASGIMAHDGSKRTPHSAANKPPGTPHRHIVRHGLTLRLQLPWEATMLRI